MMRHVRTIDQARAFLVESRKEGCLIGLVPTMGALHEGHLSLIRRARDECDVVVVSIFVNPIQFGPNEDYHHYPQPIEADLAKCEQAGVDLVFNPTVDQMYPQKRLTTVHVAKLTEPLCGRSRPGHFDGVTTVVAKLFNIIQPNCAYFGQKDAQQALVIRRMIEDLNLPVELRICPIIRSDQGLALSSRNAYLSDNERQRGLCLHKALELAAEKIRAGQHDAEAIIAAMRETIEHANPEQIDYIDIRDPNTLDEVQTITKPVLIALAVKIGPARLIDNIVLDEKGNMITMNILFDTQSNGGV